MNEHKSLRRRMGSSSVPITGLGSCFKSRFDGREWWIPLVTVGSLADLHNSNQLYSVTLFNTSLRQYSLKQTGKELINTTKFPEKKEKRISHLYFIGTAAVVALIMINQSCKSTHAVLPMIVTMKASMEIVLIWKRQDLISWRKKRKAATVKKQYIAKYQKKRMLTLMLILLTVIVITKS